MKKFYTLLSTMVALAISPVFGWSECWDGKCYDCPAEWQYDYYAFEKAITCDECDWGGTWIDDMPVLKRNGCTAKISKTDSKGITKFTFTYIGPDGKKQTIKYAWKDEESTDQFEYKGHICSFWWDCLPFGIFLTVDGVEHAYVLKPTAFKGNANVPAEWRKARTIKSAVYSYGSRSTGICEVKCGKANKQGIASVSLTYTGLNGKKTKYQAQKVNVADLEEVYVDWGDFYIYLYNNHCYGESITGEVWIEPALIGGELYGTTYLDILDHPSEIDGYEAIFPCCHEGPDGPANQVKMDGKKWTCPGNTKATWKKCPPNAECEEAGWQFDFSNGRSNLCGIRLTYNAKTGFFKGNFTVFVDNGKKYKANISGVVVNEVAYGQAIIKNPSIVMPVILDPYNYYYW